MEMPKAIESEQSILGAMISYHNIISEVIELLKPEEFYYESNVKIYAEIINLYNQGLIPDIGTLAQALKNKGKLKEVGGTTYLVNLYEGATVYENIKYHCNIIKDRWMKRSLIQLSNTIIRKAYDDNIFAKDIIEEGGDKLYKICDERGRMCTLSECINSSLIGIETRYKNNGDIIGETTGFKNLDKAIGGLQKGNLFVIAGRPSMGKTTLALNIASKSSKNSKVAIFSFEMSKEELADKLISDEGNIKFNRIKSGKLTDEDFLSLSKAAGSLSKRYALVYDGGALNMGEIKAKCIKAKLKNGLDIVIIDYLQLINGDSKYNNRVHEITKISRDLKNLARELDITVIALSQLSRATEGRSDKRPVLSDLRDSGGIEQDADIIALLYREEYYNRDTVEKGVCEILIGKNRNGKTGMFKLNWIPELQRFVNR